MFICINLGKLFSVIYSFILGWLFAIMCVHIAISAPCHTHSSMPFQA